MKPFSSKQKRILKPKHVSNNENMLWFFETGFEILKPVSVFKNWFYYNNLNPVLKSNYAVSI